MRLRTFVAFCCCSITVLSASAQAIPSFSQALAAARYPLTVNGQGFSGTGASVLVTALDEARFVAIGEDHFTREIPQFAAAVCDEMAMVRLTAVAMETSPAAATFVQSSFGAPDRLKQMVELQKRYPESVAFLNSRQENDFANHCAESVKSKGNSLALWGLDQEFLGSAGWILNRMLASRPGPKARSAIETMQSDEQSAAIQAKHTGDFNKVYLESATDAQIAQARVGIDADGTAQTRELFRELVQSRNLYQGQRRFAPTANAERGQLLKRNFAADYASAGGAVQPQRILIKFGDWHLYKGVNPVHQRDLGNYIAEQADGEGSRSLHILVLGVEGEHESYTGYGQPLHLFRAVTSDDSEYAWLKAATDLREKNGWTLYDLRQLRFGKAALSPDWDRVVYGYDLLVLIPELTPADLIR